MDEERTDSLIREHNGLYVDFSRQNITETTMQVRGGVRGGGEGGSLVRWPLQLEPAAEGAEAPAAHCRATAPCPLDNPPAPPHLTTLPLPPTAHRSCCSTWRSVPSCAPA